jgi:hypothetical protein
MPLETVARTVVAEGSPEDLVCAPSPHRRIILPEPRPRGALVGREEVCSRRSTVAALDRLSGDPSPLVERPVPPLRCWIDLALILFAANTLLLYFRLTVPPAPCEGPADCVKYTAMFQAFRSGTFTPIEFPFNTRVLAPLLAALLPGADATVAFQRLNWICFNLFPVLMYLAMSRLGADRPVTFLSLTWMFVHASGVSFYFSVPVNPDPLGYVISALTLLVLATLGVLQKEGYLGVLAILAACELLWLPADLLLLRRRPVVRPALCIAAGAILAVLAQRAAAAYLFPATQSWSVSSFDLVRWWWRERTQQPAWIAVWVTAGLITAGLFPVLVLFTRWAALKGREILVLWLPLVLLSLANAAFGLVAGFDSTRIVFNGAPYFFALIGCTVRFSAIRSLSIAVVAVLSLPILLLLRTGWPVFVEYAYLGGDPGYVWGWLAYLLSAAAFAFGAVWFIERSARAAARSKVAPAT